MLISCHLYVASIALSAWSRIVREVLDDFCEILDMVHIGIRNNSLDLRDGFY